MLTTSTVYVKKAKNDNYLIASVKLSVQARSGQLRYLNKVVRMLVIICEKILVKSLDDEVVMLENTLQISRKLVGVL